ncbi:MAG: SAM-dependent methyltransferase [Anaerolineae bacterium]|nr:SAM-dependent methyltransferase [Anaerolineae bacterium]
MPPKTIVDASVPNAGRVYDYLLGGHHNFEIDRLAGDRVKTMMPFLPKLMRLFRWCLGDLAYELTHERGYDTIIDFASGLPTTDHLHTAVAPGTTVIYSDRDPVCVEYGREILGGTPNVHYFQADCRQPEELLNRPDVRAILGDKRRVAFVYWGISMYLSDDETKKIAQTLYDWSSKDSCLAFYLQPADIRNESGRRIMELYKNMGEALYLRRLDTYPDLFKPWVADKLGYRSMEEWHGVESPLTEEDMAFFPEGETTVGYGVYLVKE